MNLKALGLIETIGYTTAVSAADAAVKAADVEIIGLEKVIGVSGYVGVTINLSGDVAAVSSAVEAGRKKAEMVGKVISTEVIPRAHSDVNEKLLSEFSLNNLSKPVSIQPKKSSTTQKKKKSGGKSTTKEKSTTDKKTTSSSGSKKKS